MLPELYFEVLLITCFVIMLFCTDSDVGKKLCTQLVHEALLKAWDYNSCSSRVCKFPTCKK
jgi:hypothetical protein